MFRKLTRTSAESHAESSRTIVTSVMGQTSGRADRLKLCVDTKIFLQIAEIGGQIWRRNVNQVSLYMIRVSYRVSVAFRISFVNFL